MSVKKQKINLAVIYENFNQSLVSSIQNIGTRTPLTRYRAEQPPASVAADFLINSRLVRNNHEIQSSIAHYLSDGGMTMVSYAGHYDISQLPQVSLPASKSASLSLESALTQRKSVRHYNGQAIELNSLATILRAAAGITHEMPTDLKDGQQISFKGRATASGGGLYPIDLYVAALNIKDLNKGIYYYQPHVDRLAQTHQADAVEKLFSAIAMKEEHLTLSKAAAVFLMVAKPAKAMRKYGERGLRLVFHEAGGMSQNINLAATALALGSLECASFYDDEMHNILGIDGIYETFIHSIIVGTPKKQ